MRTNKNNTPDELDKLHKKYGNITVAVVEEIKIQDYLKSPYTAPDVTVGRIFQQKNQIPLYNFIQDNLLPIPRYVAELTPLYKQVITYAILRNPNNDSIYCTTRLGGSGEARLVGGKSIGIGGHVDGDEEVRTALYRELYEEVGLADSDIRSCCFTGYIYDNSTPVNSVHLGFIFLADVNRTDIHCLEENKLSGEWVSKEQLLLYRKDGFLESWSEVAYDCCLS
jgi:predicted NUDIX family phosphoesterase